MSRNTMEAHSEVSPEHSMPLILVSARDLTSASVLVSELIGDKVTENGEVQSENVTIRKTWRIINKYYRVDVEMYSLADDEPLPALAHQIEAHIIYISDDEEQDDDAATELAEQRRTRALAAGAARSGVRLLVAAGARAAPALLAWARRRRYELVPLRQRAADDEDDDDSADVDAPFPETYGAERARAALHAHAWRGLERLDRPECAAPAPRSTLSPTSSDDDYAGAEDEDEQAAVERAEAFAEALGALGEASAARREAERGERRRRAERVVAAFCRALGSDLPAL